jgi:hypothetical protein
LIIYFASYLSVEQTLIHIGNSQQQLGIVDAFGDENIICHGTIVQPTIIRSPKDF